VQNVCHILNRSRFITKQHGCLQFDETLVNFAQYRSDTSFRVRGSSENALNHARVIKRQCAQRGK
jgi:hypothetical protein